MDDFPTKNRKRAKRRHMKMKMRQKARKIAKYIFGWKSVSENIDDYACRAADNLKKCSCEICCNPRKHKQKTIQEKRMEESFKEQLNE